MPKLVISLAQMNIALGDAKKNIAHMDKWTVEAARRGSHFILPLHNGTCGTCTHGD